MRSRGRIVGRTARIHTSRVRVGITGRRFTDATLQRRVRWWQGGRVRLIGRTLTASFTGSLLLRHLATGRRRLAIHRRRLLVPLRWWRILTWLLRALLILLTAAVRRQWLAVSTVELRVRRRLLTAPDGVRRHEGLRLGADGCEDALLREALAVGTAPIFGLIEA